MTEPERQPLEKLASEGKATRLMDEDLLIARALQEAELVLVIRDNDAIITPNGRRLLAGDERAKKSAGFLD